jgi:dipeptidyl aminopeptidase/acylaminoacyl peptidase
MLSLGLWVSLRSDSPDRATPVAVLSATTQPTIVAQPEPSTTALATTVTRVTPSATVRAPFTPTAAPSPTEQSTPVVAPITSTLEATAASGLIAFVFEQDNAGAGDIYTMRADGSHLVDITNSPESDYAPAWSPDGQQIAFRSVRTGRPEVFLVRPDGTGLRQLTHTPPDVPNLSDFAWSPDGARLALTRYAPPTSNLALGALELMPLDGSPTTTISQTADQPQWSPDGRWLAFEGLDSQNRPAVYVAHGNGVGAQLIVNTAGQVTGTSELLNSFVWAPDSKRLAYMMEGPLTGVWPNQNFSAPSHVRLYTVRPDGTGRQLLLELHYLPDGLIGLNWSPDGRFLLYLIGHSDGGCFTPHLLAVATRLDTNLPNVCYLPRTTLPDWSPGGRYLLLSAQPGSSILLLDVAEALRHPQKVAGTWMTLGPDFAWSPVWQPLVRPLR